jgi:Uma2 family endonuclease
MATPLRKMPADEDPETAAWRADPFRYGSRWKRVRLPDGKVIDQEIPLTPEDLLDPQPGDEVPQSGPHAQVVNTLYDLLQRHFKPDPDVLVLFDMKILWGIPGLSQPSPDVAVVRGVRDKKKARSTFKIAEEGVLPCLTIEVVSYSDAEVYQNDHAHKVELYQRVGIPEYLIVDPPPEPAKDPAVLTGYRLAADGRYRRIVPDSQGRILSETTNLLFGPSEDGCMVRVYDAGTGELLLISSEVDDARKAAEERALREAEARRAAEEARRAAEERAIQEAEARRAAEEAGKAAEERAIREAEARRAAEAENARLRAEIEGLKNR